MSEVEVRPILTDDLRAFWTCELRALAVPQRQMLLGLLAGRYGLERANEIGAAVGR